MTGYGKSEVKNGHYIVVEIKSVNNRFFECSAKVPRTLNFLEEKLKTAAHSVLSRGKIDIYLTFDSDELNSTVDINHAVAANYIDAIKALANVYQLDSNISAFDIAKLPDVLKHTATAIDQDEIWSLVEPIAQSALEQFVTARQTEGQRLRDDIISRVSTLNHHLQCIISQYPTFLTQYKEKLENSIRELTATQNIDETRLLTEVAILADKSAIDEETVRLASHIEELNILCNAAEPVGRKFEFLLQETNREVNTIGSKSQSIEITKLVVEMKSELEKIREQIQNVE